MKKIIAFTFLFMFALCATVNSRTIVVKGDQSKPTGSTEVFTENPDTIIVVPGDKVSGIEINLKDENNSTISQFYLDAQRTSSINLDTPTHNGNVIEIKDNIGVVFKLTE